MKKLITSFIVLFLIGFGTKTYAQAAGDFVYVQAASTDSSWTTIANWKISDGNGGYDATAPTVLPGATNNVWIANGSKLGVVPVSATGVTCSTASGSTTITLSASNTNIKAGMAVRTDDANATMYLLQPGTYVESVNGTTVTLSKPALRTYTSTKLQFYPACKNLNISGTFRSSTQFVVYGDITVNSGAVFFQSSDLYCKNINNKGTFKSTGGWRAHKTLYLGYEGATPGNGDYSIVNDAVFGSPSDAIVIPAVNDGSGIALIYSNQANSVTIKKSTSSVSANKFNISWIQPTGYIKTEANTTLNIQQSMSVMRNGAICLSVQNNDSSLNTTRTCNIDPGVTVYVGSRFHANGGVTSAPQGNVVYNVYGTLDLGTYCSQNNKTTAEAGNVTDFCLAMTTASGNTGSLTFNLGDGTQANAGTLVLGSNIKLIKYSNQALNVNIKDYSTVKVLGNYGWQMNYQLLNDNVPALYLFPTKYYNLSLDGTKVVLPVKPGVKGTFTNSSSNVGYTTTNWVASVAGVTTNATSLYVAAASLPQGSIVNTGSAYYYVPVVRSVFNYPATTTVLTRANVPANDTIANYIAVGQYASVNSSAVTAKSATDVTIATATTNTSAVSNATITFTGIQGTTAPTGQGTAFNPTFDGGQPLIYLGGSEFVGYTQIVSSVNNATAMSARIYSDLNGQLVIDNATAGDIVSVYSVSGLKVASKVLSATKNTLNIASGMYLVKINNSVAKVMVK